MIEKKRREIPKQTVLYKITDKLNGKRLKKRTKERKQNL